MGRRSRGQKLGEVEGTRNGKEVVDCDGAWIDTLEDVDTAPEPESDRRLARR